ncbi:hypothetical protein Ocin01_18211 [Orchesella cincta]|uniref:Uncharacterized protein n=1 Tax=Orchesella cincta TaxID=48709 RepID=A0A1D2M6D3_ORCCI|nr:hypothetical protein Ocin01_18211 [Orchesella cincta]
MKAFYFVLSVAVLAGFANAGEEHPIRLVMTVWERTGTTFIAYDIVTRDSSVVRGISISEGLVPTGDRTCEMIKRQTCVRSSRRSCEVGPTLHYVLSFPTVITEPLKLNLASLCISERPSSTTKRHLHQRVMIPDRLLLRIQTKVICAIPKNA